MDYHSGPYTVTFSPGQTSAVFDIPITDDNILEGNYSFMLTMNSSSLPNNVTRGNPDRAMVTIVDNDGKYVGYGN